jgi:hypothetical protein
MLALQAIANMQNKSGQQIIQAITQSARELKARGIPLRLEVPGHCGDLEAMQLIDWPKKQLVQTRNIPFGIFSREYRDTSAKESKRSRSRKGKHRRKAATSAE